MAAGKTAIPITPAQRFAGFPEGYLKPEAASQTYKAGVPVVVTAGRIAECGAAPASILGFSERLGQNGTAGQYKSHVFSAANGARFTATLTGTLPAAPEGTDAGLVKDAGGQWYLDTAAGTKQCTIVGVESKWVKGTDTNAEVQFVVKAANVQNA